MYRWFPWRRPRNRLAATVLVGLAAATGVPIGAVTGAEEPAGGDPARAVPDENPNRELLERIQQKLKQINQMMQQRRSPAVPPTPPSLAPRHRAESAAGPSGDPASGRGEPRAAQDRESATTLTPPASIDPAPTPTAELPPPPPWPEGTDPALQRRNRVQEPRQELVRQPSSTERARSKSIESIPLLEKPVDLIKAARSLLKGGQYREALRLYRAIPRDAVSAEQWHWLQYEQALCWKRLGDMDAAARIYRELASAATDPELRESCRWQLESLQWRRQVSEQLRQLTAGREAERKEESTQ